MIQTCHQRYSDPCIYIYVFKWCVRMAYYCICDALPLEGTNTHHNSHMGPKL